MRLGRIILFTIFIFFIFSVSRSTTPDARPSTLDFLLSTQLHASAFDRLGAGVRAKGMGDAFTAISDDASSVYWNQAGISQITKKNIILNYRDLYSLGLINYGEIFFIQPGIWRGGLGFGVRHFGTSAKVDFIDYNENTFTIAYGCEIKKNLRLGAALKYYDVDYDIDANGFGIDVSAMYSFGDYFTLGVLIQDCLEPEIEWETRAVDRLPLNIRTGLAFKWEEFLNVDIDVDKIADDEDDEELHIGLEYWLPQKIIGIRVGGYQQRSSKWVGTMGFGLRYDVFQLDYSYEHHYLLSSTHFFSVGLEF
ncbi:MAG: PorV/PorQ family protein [Candidatus Hydrogenedentota bacterium]